MSDSEINLVCNYKKCRVPLKNSAWATICSHIFCDNDGSQILKQVKKCLCCNKILNKTLDIIQINLNPDESFKSMILCGLRPEIVMDIALRAVTFWNYQITQEKIIQTTLTCTKQQQCKFEQEKKQNLNVYKKANAALKDAELQRRRIREIKEKLVEKNKILHTVKTKYESLKRQLISYTVQSAKPLKPEQTPKALFKTTSFEDHTHTNKFSFAPIF